MTNRPNMKRDLGGGQEGWRGYLRLHRAVHGGGLGGTIGERFGGARRQRRLLRSRTSLGGTLNVLTVPLISLKQCNCNEMNI